MTRTVVVLGSTGSIGTQALSVISDHRDRFRVAALGSGGTSVAQFAWQLVEFGAEVAAITDATAAGDLRIAIEREAFRRGLGGAGYRPPRILAGPFALAEAAALPCDVVLNAVSGPAGLPLTLAALDAGRTVALANNDSLVVGGRLVTDRAVPGQIVPVHPGHAALAQCLRSGDPAEVRRLVLTAAGSPFRGRRRAQLASVTPREALSHPAGSLGPVSSVNQATLVNKGLELIEAHLLFGVAYDDIEVLIHPQGVVHSMVEFVDGSTIAQLAPPEPGLSLLWALAWPERVAAVGAGLDWTKASALTFTPLDEEHYPAVALAAEVGRIGGSAPAVYHAANEECVAAFLAGRIKFPQIVDTIARVVSEHTVAGKVPTLDEIQAARQWAGARTREHVAGPVRRIRAGLQPYAAAGPARYARRVLLAGPRQHLPGSGRAEAGPADVPSRTAGRAGLGGLGGLAVTGRGEVDWTTGTYAGAGPGAGFGAGAGAGAGSGGGTGLASGIGVGTGTATGTRVTTETAPIERAAFDRTPVDRATLDRAAMDLPTVDCAGMDLSAVDLAAVDLSAMDLSAADRAAIDRAAADRSTIDHPAIDRPAYDHPAMDRPAYGHAAMDRPAIDHPAMDRPAHDRAAYDRTSYDRPTYDRPTYDRVAYDRAAYDRAAFERAEADRAVRDVAMEADLVLVIGRADSADSARLVQVALDAGAAAAYLLQDPAGLDPRWLDGVAAVGVTGAAGTPADLVGRVLDRLSRSGYDGPVLTGGAGRTPERMIFARPYEPRVGR